VRHPGLLREAPLGQEGDGPLPLFGATVPHGIQTLEEELDVEDDSLSRGLENTPEDLGFQWHAWQDSKLETLKISTY